MHYHAFRLHPGDDLKQKLQQFVNEKNIAAAVLLSAVGSLDPVHLRYAGKSEGAVLSGPHEICAATGTLGRDGLHIHLTVSDGEGETSGGHLLDGCIIYTTAEIVLGELPDMTFERRVDEATGYKELFVIQGK